MVLYRWKSPKMTETFSAWHFDPATWHHLAVAISRMRLGPDDILPEVMNQRKNKLFKTQEKIIRQPEAQEDVSENAHIHQ